MKKFTINQFREAYPNDDACLDKIFQLRFGELSICPKCEKDSSFARVKNRRAYQCLHCGFQLYPTANTIFEKTTTPLCSWFYAIYLQTTTRNGVAAKELERQLNICYKTALRMAHQIKILMGSSEKFILSGIVETDECYVGGKISNMHLSKRKAMGAKKFSHAMKTPVVGMIERKGRVTVKVLEELNRVNISRLVSDNLQSDARLITDTSSLYEFLSTKFTHDMVNHDRGMNLKEGMFIPIQSKTFSQF